MRLTPPVLRALAKLIVLRLLLKPPLSHVHDIVGDADPQEQRVGKRVDLVLDGSCSLSHTFL